MPFIILDNRCCWRDNGNLRDGCGSKRSAAPKNTTIDHSYGRKRAHCQGADMESVRDRYQFDIASPHPALARPPQRPR